MVTESESKAVTVAVLAVLIGLVCEAFELWRRHHGDDRRRREYQDADVIEVSGEVVVIDERPAETSTR